MYFQVEKTRGTWSTIICTKKSSLFLLMYFQVEKIQKAAALKKHCNHNCIYTRITVLKKHCNSARVICSTKLYGKYKKHKSRCSEKNTVIIKCIYTRVTNWYQSTQNCKIIEPLAHHLFSDELVPKYPKL